MCNQSRPASHCSCTRLRLLVALCAVAVVAKGQSSFVVVSGRDRVEGQSTRYFPAGHARVAHQVCGGEAVGASVPAGGSGCDRCAWSVSGETNATQCSSSTACASSAACAQPEGVSNPSLLFAAPNFPLPGSNMGCELPSAVSVVVVEDDAGSRWAIVSAGANVTLPTLQVALTSQQRGQVAELSVAVPYSPVAQSATACADVEVAGACFAWDPARQRGSLRCPAQVPCVVAFGPLAAPFNLTLQAGGDVQFDARVATKPNEDLGLEVATIQAPWSSLTLTELPTPPSPPPDHAFVEIATDTDPDPNSISTNVSLHISQLLEPRFATAQVVLHSPRQSRSRLLAVVQFGPGSSPRPTDCGGARAWPWACYSREDRVVVLTQLAVDAGDELWIVGQGDDQHSGLLSLQGKLQDTAQPTAVPTGVSASRDVDFATNRLTTVVRFQRSPNETHTTGYALYLARLGANASEPTARWSPSSMARVAFATLGELGGEAGGETHHGFEVFALDTAGFDAFVVFAGNGEWLGEVGAVKQIPDETGIGSLLASWTTAVSLIATVMTVFASASTRSNTLNTVAHVLKSVHSKGMTGAVSQRYSLAKLSNKPSRERVNPLSVLFIYQSVVCTSRLSLESLPTACRHLGSSLGVFVGDTGWFAPKSKSGTDALTFHEYIAAGGRDPPGYFVDVVALLAVVLGTGMALVVLQYQYYKSHANPTKAMKRKLREHTRLLVVGAVVAQFSGTLAGLLVVWTESGSPAQEVMGILLLSITSCIPVFATWLFLRTRHHLQVLAGPTDMNTFRQRSKLVLKRFVVFFPLIGGAGTEAGWAAVLVSYLRVGMAVVLVCLAHLPTAQAACMLVVFFALFVVTLAKPFHPEMRHGLVMELIAHALAMTTCFVPLVCTPGEGFGQAIALCYLVWGSVIVVMAVRRLFVPLSALAKDPHTSLLLLLGIEPTSRSNKARPPSSFVGAFAVRVMGLVLQSEPPQLQRAMSVDNGELSFLLGRQGAARAQQAGRKRFAHRAMSLPLPEDLPKTSSVASSHKGGDDLERPAVLPDPPPDPQRSNSARHSFLLRMADHHAANAPPHRSLPTRKAAASWRGVSSSLFRFNTHLLGDLGSSGKLNPAPLPVAREEARRSNHTLPGSALFPRKDVDRNSTGPEDVDPGWLSNRELSIKRKREKLEEAKLRRALANGQRSDHVEADDASFCEHGE